MSTQQAYEVYANKRIYNVWVPKITTLILVILFPLGMLQLDTTAYQTTSPSQSRTIQPGTSEGTDGDTQQQPTGE